MIVAFDPGRNLGVCRAPSRDKKAVVHDVSLYTRKLRDTTDLGAYLRSADDHIREAIRGTSEVVIEEPNTQGQNHSGIVKNVALAAHIAYWATLDGVPWRFINLRHAKVILTDNGAAKKEQMMPAAEFLLGLPRGRLTEHEADAFGIWMVASFGVPESSSARKARHAKERREAKEAAKASAKASEGVLF